MNSRTTQTKHPAHGLSARAVEVFEAFCTGQTPPLAPRTTAALLRRGLIEQVGERIVHQDRFGAMTAPVYEVPLSVHMAWCQWCAENVPDA